MREQLITHTDERIETPWGRADFATHVAEGVDFYSTPSHGGYRLSAKRAAFVPDWVKARTFVQTWRDGSVWFEEDCEWASVCLTFPELFPARAVAHAVSVVLRFFTPRELPGRAQARLKAWLRGEA